MGMINEPRNGAMSRGTSLKKPNIKAKLLIFKGTALGAHH
jgi:hypothetical protein